MIRKTLTNGLALAVLATASLAMSQPASARMHRMKMAKVHLVPSQPKPTFVAAPYGVPMMLVDIPRVPAGGGALGLGLVPSSGFFKGVPVFGELGL